MRKRELYKMIKEELKAVLAEQLNQNMAKKTLVKAFKLAGYDISEDSIEQVSTSKDTTSFDVTLYGEPYQVDIDNSKEVFLYDGVDFVSLGYLNNPRVIANNIEKLIG